MSRSAAHSFDQPEGTTTGNGGTGFGMHDEAAHTFQGTPTGTRSNETRSGGGAGLTGSRGAIGVVGVVGLLAAGSVVVTLALTGGHHDDRANGSSGSTSSSGHNRVGIDGLDTLPTLTGDASADGADKHGPAVEATKKSPDGKAVGDPTATATASSTAGSKAHVQAPASGVQLVSHSSRRCIDVAGGKAARGAQLIISACSRNTPSQHWVFAADGTLRALGMCVQLAGGSTDDGTGLELAPCNGRSEQKFTLNSSNDLVNRLADKCADIRDNGTADGTRLQLWSCAGTDNQKWSAA
ncbi:RICIN domain-containing protein [Streptomyces adustus]|uniref:RICIN domain-containing protein n=1 Tax=Streptomyces adustus TaxID=1609272 RepID=UPI001390DA94|nr:RICIN domain-containing protein [Streptomyces adustus]